LSMSSVSSDDLISFGVSLHTPPILKEKPLHPHYVLVLTSFLSPLPFRVTITGSLTTVE
jgi:hypothetical protein